MNRSIRSGCRAAGSISSATTRRRHNQSPSALGTATPLPVAAAPPARRAAARADGTRSWPRRAGGTRGAHPWRPAGVHQRERPRDFMNRGRPAMTSTQLPARDSAARHNRQLAARPPAAIRLTKMLTKRATAQAVAKRIREESEHFDRQLRSPEAAEALAAFTRSVSQTSRNSANAADLSLAAARHAHAEPRATPAGTRSSTPCSVMWPALAPLSPEFVAESSSG